MSRWELSKNSARVFRDTTWEIACLWEPSRRAVNAGVAYQVIHHNVDTAKATRHSEAGDSEIRSTVLRLSTSKFHTPRRTWQRFLMSSQTNRWSYLRTLRQLVSVGLNPPR